MPIVVPVTVVPNLGDFLVDTNGAKIELGRKIADLYMKMKAPENCYAATAEKLCDRFVSFHCDRNEATKKWARFPEWTKWLP